MINQITELGVGSFMTTTFIALILILIIYISMMVWVYKDAKQRNMEPVLYLVLVFFFGCCGIIIYLIARAEYPVGNQGGFNRSQEPRMNTTHQQHPQTLYGQTQYAQTQAPPSQQSQNVNNRSKFCKYCGGEMPNDARFCSICGANEFNN